MRILILASTVPANDDDAVPRFVLDQARAMASVDPELEVLLLAPHTPASRGQAWPQPDAVEPRVVQDRFRYGSGPFETLTERGIMPALAARPWLALAIPSLLIAEVWAAKRRARRFLPSVVYAHWFTPQAIAANAAAKVAGVPWGFTTHAADVIVWRRFGALGRRVVRHFAERASFITAVSNQTAAKLWSFFEGDAKTRLENTTVVLPMGVDVPAAPLPLADTPHVAIVARLVEKKGIHVLLDAWPSVVDRVPGAALTIAGDGPWMQRLRDQADRLGIDVGFPGFVTGELKERVIASATVVAQPSVVAADGDADGFPVATLEALAAGRVVVASNASGAQDVLKNGVNGLVVPAGDSVALADALVHAMTMDDASRAAMLARGRETVEVFSWARVARQHLELMGPWETGDRARPADQL